MGSVLSQEEVDALLQGVTSDEEVSEEDEEEYNLKRWYLLT